MKTYIAAKLELKHNEPEKKKNWNRKQLAEQMMHNVPFFSFPNDQKIEDKLKGLIAFKHSTFHIFVSRNPFP